MNDVILGTFAACVAGGVLPWLNTEVVVTASALLVAPTDITRLVAAAAAGQTVAKTSLYALARWAPHILPEKARRMLARGRLHERGGWSVALALLASASVGVPPFFLCTLAAGALRVPLAVFASAGLAGSTARYGALAYGATLVSSGFEFGLP